MRLSLLGLRVIRNRICSVSLQFSNVSYWSCQTRARAHFQVADLLYHIQTSGLYTLNQAEWIVTNLYQLQATHTGTQEVPEQKQEHGSCQPSLRLTCVVVLFFIFPGAPVTKKKLTQAVDSACTQAFFFPSYNIMTCSCLAVYQQYCLLAVIFAMFPLSHEDYGSVCVKLLRESSGSFDFCWYHDHIRRQGLLFWSITGSCQPKFESDEVLSSCLGS